ncbi:MAG: hypothetical protein WDA47_07140, partial [Bacilli bacterium]
TTGSFITDILNAEADYIKFQGVKYVSNKVLEIPGSIWASDAGFDLSTLGYQEAKYKQLSRNYFAEDNIKAAKEKLGSREGSKFSSVGIILNANPKRKSSQGHCMLAMAVSRAQKSKPRITVFYRITEVICKFGADLLFLKNKVIPEIIGDEEPEAVSFHFANVFLSPLFIPIIIPYIEDIPIFLDIIRNTNDEKVFKGSIWALSIPFIRSNPDYYNYRTRRHMHQMGIKNYGKISKEHYTKVKKYIEKEKPEWIESAE